jgi:hypothetical protein
MPLLNLCTKAKQVVSFTLLQILPSGKEYPVFIGDKPDGSHSYAIPGGDERHFYISSGNRNLAVEAVML